MSKQTLTYLSSQRTTPIGARGWIIFICIHRLGFSGPMASASAIANWLRRKPLGSLQLVRSSKPI